MLRPVMRLRPLMRHNFSTFTPQRFLNRYRGKSNFYEEPPEKLSYNVRLQKPPLFTRRKVLYILTFILLAHYFSPYYIEIVAEDNEDESLAEAGSPEQEENEDEYDEDEEDAGIFLPMTWPKLGPKEFYRGTDPEWQEYIKLSKNKDRQKRIFDELVQVIRKMCGDGSNISGALGSVDLTKGRHWLDVIFPPGPPRHYEQTGIEFAPGYIAITTREVSEQEYQQLKRWFNYTAVFKSIGATCVEVFGLPIDRLKEMFGNNGQASSPNGGPMLPSSGSKTGGPTGMIGLGPPNKGAAGTSAPANSPPHAGNPGPNQSQTVPGTSGHPGHGPDAITSKLMKTFLSTFNAQNSIDPPRGSIILSGLVECIGTRASTTVDVVACYDLFNDRFLVISPKVRRLTEYRQRPRGR